MFSLSNNSAFKKAGNNSAFKKVKCEEMNGN